MTNEKQGLPPGGYCWGHHPGALFSLQWRHNERGRVSNHQRLHCLANCRFKRRSKKTSKLRVTGLCVGNSPVTGEFPAQKVRNAENVTFDDVIMSQSNHSNQFEVAAGTWSSDELQWLGFKVGHQESSPTNDHQGNIPNSWYIVLASWGN